MMTREERIAELSEKWFNEAKAAGFSHAEGMAAAGHLLFMVAAEAKTMDTAAQQLADTYLTLMNRLMIRYDVTTPPQH